MAKKVTKKKEKYITERISKAGTHSFEVNIRAYGQTFHKNVKISDFDTPTQALQFACKIRDETLQKMRTGYTVSAFPTVRQLYEKTFEVYPVRKNTRNKHEFVFKQVIEEYGDISIDQISSADIAKTVNVYGETHTKKDTARVLSIWHRIYKTCAMMNVNVIDRTVPVKIPECAYVQPRKKEISSEDLETFCDALLDYNSASITGSYRSYAVYYAIQIMKYCGLRPAETFALMKSDIHLDKGYITVNKSVGSTINSSLEIRSTKTSKSVRNVPIPSKLKPILKKCLQWSRNEILLSDYYGNLFDSKDVSTLVRNVRNKVHIDFTLYQLRHQFSTDLLSAGAPLNVVRDLMGHESGSMSLDYAVSNEKDRVTVINERKFS